MQMYNSFWYGVVINDFLFKGFNISTWGGMLGICAGSALLAFIMVTVTFTKEMLHHKLSAQQQGQAITVAPSQILQVWTSPLSMHLLQSVLSLVQILLGYFLMLIVMSFNVYLLLAVILGSILGYYFLNPYLMLKRSIYRHPRRRVGQLYCQEEECGALIGTQEQVGSIVGSSSGNSQQDSDREISVSATVHCSS